MIRARSSEEYKKAVLKRLFESSLSVGQFAVAEGIARETLDMWKKRYNIETPESPVRCPSDRWLSEEKFAVVLESSILTEIELDEYCRRRVLYPDQMTL